MPDDQEKRLQIQPPPPLPDPPGGIPRDNWAIMGLTAKVEKQAETVKELTDSVEALTIQQKADAADRKERDRLMRATLDKLAKTVESFGWRLLYFFPVIGAGGYLMWMKHQEKVTDDLFMKCFMALLIVLSGESLMQFARLAFLGAAGAIGGKIPAEAAKGGEDA